MVDSDTTEREGDGRYDRRSVLKAIGVGGAVGLAGCSGDGGDGGSDGASDGGDGTSGDGGDGGDGSDGGSTQQEDLTPMNIVYPPWPGLPAFNYITQDTDILETELNEFGYTTGEISRSWDDTTLFMAGQVDFMPTAGGAESARMAMERDIDLTVHAQAATNYMAWYVRKGSDLDPANTGGFEETMQIVIDEQRPYGHAGWNQGIVWPNSAIMYDKFDMKYGPDTNPPLNIRQADFSTLPRLLVNGDLDIAINAPPVGTSTYLVQDDVPIVPVYWEQIGLEEAGLSPRTLNLGGFTSRTEFSDNNEGAMVGWMRAWQQGIEWAGNPDNWEQILDNEDNWNYFAAESREEAEINLKFSYAENPSEVPEAHTDNPLPVILQDFALTESRVDDYMEAIERMETTGALSGSGWRDRLSFKTLDI